MDGSKQKTENNKEQTGAKQTDGMLIENIGGNQNNNGANGLGPKSNRPASDRVAVNIDRYIDNGDGTVTDKKTGLIWQKGEVFDVPLEQAKQSADRLTIGGYHDWRMPTILELLSIVDTSLNKPPFSDILGLTETEYFWSSENRGLLTRPGYSMQEVEQEKSISMKAVPPEGKKYIPLNAFGDNGQFQPRAMPIMETRRCRTIC